MGKKLTNLDASFLGQYDTTARSFHYLPSLEGAQGVWFMCPLCENHMVLCWFTNPIGAPAVPDEADPRPGRWAASGSSLANLTLNPSVSLDVPSAREAGGCLWHGWVKNGEAE